MYSTVVAGTHAAVATPARSLPLSSLSLPQWVDVTLIGRVFRLSQPISEGYINSRPVMEKTDGIIYYLYRHADEWLRNTYLLAP